MTKFLLDTDSASRLMMAQKDTVRNMRRSGSTSVGLSTESKSEMLFGAHMAPHRPDLMGRIRVFFGQVDLLAWDENAAEHHALVRAEGTRSGRAAGAFDLMIAAHALALGRTLVTSDQALHNLGITGLAIVDWSA